MNIHIDHLHININITPEPKDEAPLVMQFPRTHRGHRDHPELLESNRQLTKDKNIETQNHFTHQRYRVADKIRTLFGDNAASQFLAGIM